VTGAGLSILSVHEESTAVAPLMRMAASIRNFIFLIIYNYLTVKLILSYSDIFALVVQR
jgi:hypothetical protein